jgi:hypothetical protein
LKGLLPPVHKLDLVLGSAVSIYYSLKGYYKNKLIVQLLSSLLNCFRDR